MLQIFDALFETVFRLGREYGPAVALVVLVLAAGGFALRAISSFRPRDR
jgi:hypothetical protein